MLKGIVKNVRSIKFLIILVFTSSFLFSLWLNFYFSKIHFTLTKAGIQKVRALPSAPMDIFFTDWNGDGSKDLVVTRLNMDGKSYLKSDVQFFENKAGIWSERPEIKLLTEHARHLVSGDLNHDGVLDFVLSDHGPDLDPFPGGMSQIYLSSPQGPKPVLEKKLPWHKNFTYSSCIFDANHDDNLDILQINMSYVDQGQISNNTDGIYAFIGDGKGNFLKSNWMDSTKPFPTQCFMSCFTADLDNDGDQEIILGGCDLDPKLTPEYSYDVVLQRTRADAYGLVSKLPPRLKNLSWGTAHITAGHFRANSLNLDLLMATHDFGFKEAAIQLFENQGAMKFVAKEFPYHHKPGTDSFIPWLKVGDINNDKLDDVLVVIRTFTQPRDQQVQLFLSTGDGFKTVELPPLSDNELIVGGDIFDFNGDGKNEIVLVTYNLDFIVLTPQI
jgi:hypothetical protein